MIQNEVRVPQNEDVKVLRIWGSKRVEWAETSFKNGHLFLQAENGACLEKGVIKGQKANIWGVRLGNNKTNKDRSGCQWEYMCIQNKVAGIWRDGERVIPF